LISFSRSATSFSRKIRKLTGYRPGNKKLYELAFRHRSASALLKDGTPVNNERLEFLGDAIFGAVIADYLFTQFPNRDEGKLTQMRSRIVNREFMNSLALTMGINEFIISQSLNTTKNISGNTLEALTGALFIDKGYRKTRKFILKKIIKLHISNSLLLSENKDYKSLLIQWGQKNKKEICFEIYEMIDEMEKLPRFVASVKVMDDKIGEGSGYTKKEAQQRASRTALKNLPS
jgi:ribonuclease III